MSKFLKNLEESLLSHVDKITNKPAKWLVIVGMLVEKRDAILLLTESPFLRRSEHRELQMSKDC